MDRRPGSANTAPDPVLDRLIERRGDGPGATARGEVREARDAVRLDLENLLNTRWRFIGGADDQTELRVSLVNYGIPDFTGAPFADSTNQRQFCRVLEDAIRAYEPRLRMAKVALRNDGGDDRILRFRIEAVLVIGDVSERTVFESVLDPGSTLFRVGFAS